MSKDSFNERARLDSNGQLNTTNIKTEREKTVTEPSTRRMLIQLGLVVIGYVILAILAFSLVL
jgi:hypothetical protein